MQSLHKDKIAFVIPWFGKDVPGGAENATKSLIEHLKPYFEIEVLTTCIKDFHSDWNCNFWREGDYEELGVVIRRFEARKRDPFRFDQINLKLMRGERVSSTEERIFIEDCVCSDNLNKYISEKKGDYKWFIFIPYMFGTTYEGVFAAGEKAVLIPCLHDEGYVHMDIYREMFDKSRKALFLTTTEKSLAEKLFSGNVDKFYFAGLGLDTEVSDIKNAFKKKHGLGDFLLCAGRKDGSKNTPELVAFFDRYCKERNATLKLVLIGPGQVQMPDNDNIIDLGFVSKEDQFNAMTDALALVNPSHNESFSIVIMESWLCGRPVLVSGECAVTKDHAMISNGGLFYDDYYTFAECIDYFQQEQKLLEKMAESGREYVKRYFNWNSVVSNYLKALNE